jgi:hypothetical protein
VASELAHSRVIQLVEEQVKGRVSSRNGHRICVGRFPGDTEGEPVLEQT